jgi:biopolymer transport protein TolR
VNSKAARCITESRNMVLKRSRHVPLICTIDVNGFAAVMLALLAMFMAPVMAVDFLPRPSVDLPKATNAHTMRDADREDAVVIGIARDGKPYLNNDPVELEQLARLIRDLMSAGAERKVFLKIDRRARYGVVVNVLAEVRAAGVENIAFLAEK